MVAHDTSLLKMDTTGQQERTMDAAEPEETLKTEEHVSVENEPEIHVVQPMVEMPVSIETPESAKRRRRELSLSEKVQLIHESQDSTKSQRMLATIYQIGKTTVHEILKKKEEILRAYEENYQFESGRKRMCNRSIYGDINKLTWQWYERMRAQGKQISGPSLQEKARSFAAELDMKEFRASNGWLEGFRRRHGISFSSSFPGYETSVNVTTEWTEKILEVTEGYRSTDIYNLVETGLYYRALPDKAIIPTIEENYGTNERMTVTLCCNMDGEFEKPIVIGQEASPPCFRTFDKEGLPVVWRSNRRAWITTTIFADWLRAFDRNMRKQERRVLLFLDNSPPHPPNLQLTNVKLVFLIKPSSSNTNQLQPLTQGILDVFRRTYRRKVLYCTLAKLDITSSPQSAKHLMQGISELDACFWIASVLEEISGATMIKCFESAGFLVNIPLSLSSYSMAFPVQREGPVTTTSPLNTSTPKTTKPSKSKSAKQRKAYATDGLFEELLTFAAHRIRMEMPMNAGEYVAFDTNLKVADDLSEGWEERLVEDFCRNKKRPSPESTPLNSGTGGESGSLTNEKDNVDEDVHSYSEAFKLNKKLMGFALDENDGDLLSALYRVETQMQSSHFKKLAGAKQADVEMSHLVPSKTPKSSSKKSNHVNPSTSSQTNSTEVHEASTSLPQSHKSEEQDTQTLPLGLSDVISHLQSAQATHEAIGQREVIVEINTANYTVVPESTAITALIAGVSEDSV